MGWPTIFALTAVTAVTTGLTLGIVSTLAGTPLGFATVGVGAVTGLVSAILIGRRRALLARELDR